MTFYPSHQMSQDLTIEKILGYGREDEVVYLLDSSPLNPIVTQSASNFSISVLQTYYVVSCRVRSQPSCLVSISASQSLILLVHLNCNAILASYLNIVELFHHIIKIKKNKKNSILQLLSIQMFEVLPDSLYLAVYLLCLLMSALEIQFRYRKPGMVSLICLMLLQNQYRTNLGFPLVAFRQWERTCFP